MRVFLIHAHPVETSFSVQLRDVVRDTLLAKGHSVDLLSLYDECFDALLSREERLNYHDEARNVTPEIARYVERLRMAEAVVLVHPIWNFGMPAIMKGFFDRVFVPGVAFRLQNGEGGRMTRIRMNISKVTVITTYGGPRLRAILVGDPPRRVARRVLWAIFRPPRPVRYLALYDMNNNSAERLAVFREKVRREMANF